MILQVLILARSNSDLLGIVFVPEHYNQTRLHSLITATFSERYIVHVMPVNMHDICQVPTYVMLKPVGSGYHLFTVE